MRRRDRDQISICCFTLSETKSWEFCLGLPRDWQEPKYLGHHLLPGWHISRELDGKWERLYWGSTLSWGTDVASSSSTCCAQRLPLPSAFKAVTSETQASLKTRDLHLFFKICFFAISHNRTFRLKMTALSYFANTPIYFGKNKCWVIKKTL